MSTDDQQKGSQEASNVELDGYLSEVLHKTLGGEVAAADASVILPDREDLTIRLVSQHSLERLRDAEADKAVYDNLLWCLLGGIIGFATNVVTGSRNIDATGYMFLSCIIAAAISVLIMRRRLLRRLGEARERVHLGKDRSQE